MNQAYQEAKSSNHGSMNISVKRKIYAKRQHGKRDRGSHPRTNKAQLTLGLQGCNAMGLEMLVAVVAAEKHFLAHVALVRALQFTCAQATEGDQHFTLWLLWVAEGWCLLNCSTYTTIQAKFSIFLVCTKSILMCMCVRTRMQICTCVCMHVWKCHTN